MIEEFAAAKVNLTLHILGRRPDGYHELHSLVAFARDAGDRLRVQIGAPLSLETSGPEATTIEGANLVMVAADQLLATNPNLAAGAIQLEKYLPVASGIGGGSADAAAAIRAIARANDIADPAAAFGALAATIGADIPVCIGDHGQPTAAIMSGIGEQIWRPTSTTLLPPEGLAAILVNPRVGVPTAAVFKALAASPLKVMPNPTQEAMAASQMRLSSLDDCLALISASRNDLEAPAIQFAPIIADVLCRLRQVPDCRIARMSGSGATCFALFDDMATANHAAAEIRAAQPNWWVCPTRLN